MSSRSSSLPPPPPTTATGDFRPSSDVRVSSAVGSSSQGTGQRRQIWGTTVDTTLVQRRFEDFLRDYPREEKSKVYPSLLRDAVRTSQTTVAINAEHVLAFSQELYAQMVDYPQEVIPVLDEALQKEATELYVEELGVPQDEIELQIRGAVFNLGRSINMRQLDPLDLDRLISIKGMVIRVGAIIPDPSVGFFRCLLCRQEVDVPVLDGRLQPEKTCPNCRNQHTMELVHNRSTFGDKQLIKVQETPDEIPEGETPHTVLVWAHESNCDAVKPGDRVEITGVYRALGRRRSARQRARLTVWSTYVDVVHFKKLERKAAETPGAQDEEAMARKREQMLRIAQMPDLYQKLTDSLAPSIFKMDDVKKGVLCLLFGGTNASQGAKAGRFRGEINVLLCGDPGTSKSQILQYVHKIAPRGIYTSGKGSSAVGLTAYVTKDPDTKELVLESGALVLSDRGVCCIDEFDKMNDSTRSILHEVMEQQTVSVAKAGIVATLNARTSILASANPVNSRYDPEMSVVENIKLGPTLLSRFDLIYLVLDKPDEDHDKSLAKHLVSLYYRDSERKQRSGRDLLSRQELADYIAFTRENVHPQLTDEAQDRLVQSYAALRDIGRSGGENTISATPRQLESLIRLAEALARMRCQGEVTVDHVHEAKRLMDVATQAAIMDARTGKISLDKLYSAGADSDSEDDA